MLFFILVDWGNPLNIFHLGNLNDSNNMENVFYNVFYTGPHRFNFRLNNLNKTQRAINSHNVLYFNYNRIYPVGLHSVFLWTKRLILI